VTTDLGNDPDTTPLPVLAPGPDPAEAAAPATGPRQAAYRTGVVHQALLNLCALGLVLTVIPLVVLQIPDAVAWVVPPRVAAAGPGAVASLLRASGLALPAMAVAGSLAAGAALAAAAGHWALVAAAVTGAVAVAMACTPVRGAGGIPDHG
jgi:hypothetical protein